ncbi:MAG: oligosaccharyl transferase, archaeosortase A system-associated, partial [Methanothrix sp.]
MDMKKDTDSKKQSRKRLPEIYWYAGLGMLFLLSIYLRAVVPFRNVFIGDAVRFSSESDAWYHMMLAKTTFLHWQRPWFDPLTNFPNGTPIHFGPFLSWGVALLSKIVGLGGSDLHTVDVVGAFWPVIMGSLLILPVYYIGKELGGRGCGITAAALTVVLPGQLFSRTVLGFTDHHSSEILLSTLSMLLFILAFRSGRFLSFSTLRDLNIVKRPLLLSVLAGISLGLYVDAWSMGILFEGILLISITLQSVVEHYRRRSGEYLGIIGAIGLFLAFLMVVPFAHSYNRFSIIQYSLFQPSMLLLGSIFCLALAVVSREISRRGLSWASYLGSVALVIVLSTLIVFLALPELFSMVVYGLKTYMLPRTGGAATVAELSPIYVDLGRGVTGIDENFPGVIRILSPFYIAIIGLCMLVYRYLRDSRAPYLLLIVWSAVTLIITLAANRSAYYYAVNVALLCGYLASLAYARAGLSDIEDVLARSPSNLTREVRPERLASAAAVILIVIILAYPSVLSSHAIARYSVGPNQDWVSSIEWLRNNTPYPGLDIYNVYERPPEGQYFQYPETAYGVMSWWDYGHLIETIGHRYPNANPFQEGIGSKSKGTPGSSPFFLAESEGEAEDVLTRLNESRPPYMNARYIMTDVEMAVTKFHAIAAWSSIPLTRYTGAVYQPQADSLVPLQVWMP